MKAGDLTAAFDDLARRGPWTGADSTASVPISNGTTVWLFSDTMLGTINPDGSRDRDTPMIRNSAVTQHGHMLRFGGLPQRPTTLIAAGSVGDEFAWIGSGRQSPAGLEVLVNLYRPTGPGQFDFVLTGTQLATLNPVTMLPKTTTRTLHKVGCAIAWGSAILETPAATYVYGSEFDHETGRRYAHVAWLVDGTLGGCWKFWTGYGWSVEADRSARILSGVGTAFGVQLIGEQIVLITTDHRVAFPSRVVAYLLDWPESAGGRMMPVFSVPELAGHPDRIAYDARVHPHLAEPGHLLISYNVHSVDPDELYRDASVYRPRFVEHPYDRLARAFEYWR